MISTVCQPPFRLSGLFLAFVRLHLVFRWRRDEVASAARRWASRRRSGCLLRDSALISANRPRARRRVGACLFLHYRTFCTSRGGRGGRPSLCLLQRGCWNTHPATHAPPPTPPPVSKPNTTDQQPSMQIVSGDKLCAACQLHTWGLGWLSVTCVRVPPRLRRTTIMTRRRVSLPCTPPPNTPPVCPQPPSYPCTR